MMVKAILRRSFAALISMSLLFGAVPSFAATDCCDPANMAMHMADMAHDGAADHHQNMPCKMPAGSCASICASMAGVAVIVPQIVSVASAVVDKATWGVTAPYSGITQPPALPPPISIV